MKIALKGLILLPCYLLLYPMGLLKSKLEEHIERRNLAIDKFLLYFIIVVSYIPGIIANIFEKME